MAAKRHVLHLYRQLLREGQKFSSYNYRMYAVRRVRDSFHEHKNETNPETITVLIKKAEQNLEIIRRQVVINNMYGHEKLVVERPHDKR